MTDNLKYDTTNMMVFAAIGVVIKLFFGNQTSADGNHGPASSAMWGYGLVALSVFSVMFITFALAQERIGKLKDFKAMEFLKYLIGNSLPPILMLVVLVWLVVLNASYYKQINKGNVASEYSQFSQTSTVMVIFQLMVMFKYLSDTLKESNAK